MTCRDATEFLTDYLEGDLAESTRARFEQHLSRCPNCQVFLDQFRAAVAAGRQAYTAPDDSASECLPEDLVQVILSTVSRPRDTDR